MFRLSLILPFFISLCVMFPAVSQDEEGLEQEDSSWNFKQMPFNYQNIQVPREFWEHMKDALREGGASEENIEDFAIIPITVQVELYSEEKFILKDSLNHRLVFVEGGGTLDLFDYVVEKGVFNIKFSPGLTDEGGFHMFYVSDSPGKKIGGDAWGNGCGRIYDLTKNVGQFMLDHGMRVTSSRRHYMHLMAGTFIIFQLVEDRLYLGYIRLTDSRYPQFNCQSQQD